MDENQDDLANLLAEHSNTGTLQLVDSAYNFLITRVIYQQIWKGELSEPDFDRFAEEAWTAFVTPSIYAYHTWLVEVVDEETRSYMQAVLVDELISRVRSEWADMVGVLKRDWLSHLAS